MYFICNREPLKYVTPAPGRERERAERTPNSCSERAAKRTRSRLHLHTRHTTHTHTHTDRQTHTHTHHTRLVGLREVWFEHKILVLAGWVCAKSEFSIGKYSTTVDFAALGPRCIGKLCICDVFAIVSAQNTGLGGGSAQSLSSLWENIQRQWILLLWVLAA